MELGGQYQEGVIQFQADHRTAALDPKVHGALARPLIAWRDWLVRASLVGHDSKRYGGVSFGNLSGRVPPFPGPPGSRPFLITGTQTGGRPSLTLSDLCVVTRYDPGSNWVESFGLVRPSSESMTHGVLYDADPAIRFVFHGHSPAIWEQARALDLPTSHPAAGYRKLRSEDVLARMAALFVHRGTPEYMFTRRKEDRAVTKNAQYITLNEDNFKSEVLEGAEPVLVDFWASWCGPCHVIAPVIEELAVEFEGRAKVGKVDVDQNANLARQYGIRSIPTLLFFKDGRVVDQAVGMVTKKVLASQLRLATCQLAQGTKAVLEELNT